MANDFESRIQKCMSVLGISREEAAKMLAQDAEIDRMTSTKEIDGDMTAEQRKAAKSAKQADRKPTVYKFDSSKRKRKENLGKRALIETVRAALENAGCNDIDVTNIEREIVFHAEGVKYKIVLSAPRS